MLRISLMSVKNERMSLKVSKWSNSLFNEEVFLFLFLQIK